MTSSKLTRIFQLCLVPVALAIATGLVANHLAYPLREEFAGYLMPQGIPVPYALSYAVIEAMKEDAMLIGVGLKWTSSPWLRCPLRRNRIFGARRFNQLEGRSTTFRLLPRAASQIQNADAVL